MNRARRLAPAAVLLMTGVLPALAHDIPNERVDRAIQVILEPDRLRIDYEVGLSELTLAQDLRRLVGTLPGSDREALYRRYGAEIAPLNARGFLVSVDGRPIALEPDGFDLQVEEHPRFLFHFHASIPPSGLLSLLDTNYVASEGTSRLALLARPGVTLSGYDGPELIQNVEARPVWMLSDAEERASKSVEVSYSSTAPEPPPPTASITPPSAPVPPPSAPVPPPKPPESSSLSRLLDRGAAGSILGLWLLALGLGMAHAIQPGHGKTLVAAATLGSHGGWFRGVALALVTTLTHFSSVLLIALALWLTESTRYQSLNLTLARIAGFVIAAIGLWRLGRHLAGFGEHPRAAAPSAPSARSLLGLGVAGGLVPCWDAVLLVVLADLAGRLALGLLLLSAFSLGMASVLVIVGVLAARLRTLVDRRDRQGLWERRLGLASSLALTAVGLYLFIA